MSFVYMLAPSSSNAARQGSLCCILSSELPETPSFSSLPDGQLTTSIASPHCVQHCSCWG